MFGILRLSPLFTAVSKTACLEAARIGWQFVVLDRPSNDQTASPAFIDSFVTRLSAQALSKVSCLHDRMGSISLVVAVRDVKNPDGVICSVSKVEHQGMRNAVRQCVKFTAIGCRGLLGHASSFSASLVPLLWEAVKKCSIAGVASRGR